MLIEQIVMFSKIAQEQSISKVAQAGHISQPALSQQMRRLEEELGVKLFERSNRGIELTKEGQVMEKYAAQFIDVYSNLKGELENLNTHSGTFKIAATPVACNYALPCSLFKVNHKYSHYSFGLNSAPSKEVIRRVLHDQADLGFIVGEYEGPDLNCTLAFRDKIVLVAQQDFRVAESVTLETLKKLPIVMLNEEFSSYRLLCSYLSKVNHPIDQYRVMYQLDSTESVKSSVLAGHGVAFLPYITVKKEVYQKQIKIISVTDFDLTYDVYSIYRPGNAKEDHVLESITKYFVSVVNKSIC